MACAPTRTPASAAGADAARRTRTLTGASPRDYAAARWFEFAQRDFAARLKWTVTPTFAGANHQPKVSVTSGLNVIGRIRRHRPAHRDRDPIRIGNALSDEVVAVRRRRHVPGPITFSAPDALTTTFQVPQDATSGQTIHAILQVTDNGTPPLTSFQRVIITAVTATAKNP